LDFGIKDVMFEKKVFNRHDIFDRIANISMEDLVYAYLYCDLLSMVVLITISFKVKSLHIDMYEQYLQKCMFVKVENFHFEKGDMHVVITVESMTIVPLITIFEQSSMFFHMDSIK